MIRSFSCKHTETYFHTGKLPKKCGWKNIEKIAARKLDMIDAAANLDDLKVPPNNRLERLKGDLKGFYSIRINSQWRVIFNWKNGNAMNVAIVDYH